MNESAKILIDLMEKRKDHERKQLTLTNELLSIDQQIDAVKKKLGERVGSNIQDKFVVHAGRVVHVKYQPNGQRPHVTVHNVESD